MFCVLTVTTYRQELREHVSTTIQVHNVMSYAILKLYMYGDVKARVCSVLIRGTL